MKKQTQKQRILSCLKKFEQLPNSPAGFEVFYDKKNDVCYKKRDDLILKYHKRIKSFTEKLPFCFEKCEEVA